MFQVNGFVRQSATRHFGPKQPSLDKGVRALSGTFEAGAAAGTLVATSPYAIASISPNDGKLALGAGKSSLVVGLTSSSAGVANYTVTTTTGKTLPLTVTVTAIPTGLAPDAASQPLALAAGVVRVRAAYGNARAMDVRDSGNMPRSINFRSDGTLDPTGLSGFGDGVNFTIQTLYDTSGNGRNLSFINGRPKLIFPNAPANYDGAYIDFATLNAALSTSATFDFGGTANWALLIVARRLGYGSNVATLDRPGTPQSSLQAALVGFGTTASGILLGSTARTGTQQATATGDIYRDSLGRSASVYGQGEALPIEEAAPSLTAPWINMWVNQKGSVVSAGADTRILWKDRAHGVSAFPAQRLTLGGAGNGSSTANAAVKEILFYQPASAMTDEELRRISIHRQALFATQPVTWSPRYFITTSGQSLIDYQYSDDGPAGAGDGTGGSNSLNRRLRPKLAEALGVPEDHILYGQGGRTSRGGWPMLKWYGTTNTAPDSGGISMWDETTNSPGPGALATDGSGYYGSFLVMDTVPGLKTKRHIVLHGQGETDALSIPATPTERMDTHAASTIAYLAALRSRAGTPNAPVVVQPFAAVSAPSSPQIRYMRRAQRAYMSTATYTLAADTGHLARKSPADAHFGSLTNNNPASGGPEDGFQRAAWQDALAIAYAARKAYDNIDDPTIAYRGPEVAAMVISGASTIDATISYPANCAGTDIGSASGTLGGFRVWTDAGGLTISSTTRINATTVRLTMAAALPSSGVSAAYEPDFAPFLTHLRDNNAVLPMPVATSDNFVLN